MEREFVCAKCGCKDVTIRLKDFISRGFHDERCDEFLACGCKRCGYYWREKPNDSKEG